MVCQSFDMITKIISLTYCYSIALAATMADGSKWRIEGPGWSRSGGAEENEARARPG
jgi:hypothetical protein